ncbi:MAG TPA: histone deacetylase [Blastocatellia bacterium]|jgi:acetoin utilization deacetylase AcuC-like enzyme|nr:histone deacetylase [Blastocatellia bacterium]
MSTGLIYDSACLKHETGHHPESPQRFNVILSALGDDQTLWARLAKLAPRAAADEDITRCHSLQLIDHVRKLCERGVPFIDLDTVISPESFEVARLAAGAALTGIDQVFSGDADNAFALVRPPGHHATFDRSMGFCLFNNAAVGARYAQSRYGAERVLIIDWDVHHGNGTQDIFYRDPSVFYFSTHQYPYYPGTGAAGERGDGEGEGFTLNIPLDAGTAARAHRDAFRDALKAIEERFPPDLIIISAGFDSRRGDPLGGLMLEDSDFREMTKEVMGMAERHAGGRIVSILEGGYNLDTLGETVRTHVAALCS